MREFLTESNCYTLFVTELHNHLQLWLKIENFTNHLIAEVFLKFSQYCFNIDRCDVNFSSPL
jgi:hypothetical protein